MILVALATHAGDIDQAIELAKQITEIGGASTHKMQVVVADTAQNSKIEKLKVELKKSFYSVEVDIVKAYESRGPMDPSDAPHTPPANSMLRATIGLLSGKGNTLPILLIEPDITVISTDWLDKLEGAYIHARASGKEILAAKIPLRNYTHQLVKLEPPHTGVFRKLVSVKIDERATYSPIPMVIPPNFGEITQLFTKAKWTPWEITSRLELEDKIAPTTLIAHAHDSKNWAKDGEVFIFEAPEEDKSPREFKLGAAVLIHGTKDGSLFDLVLRTVEAPVEAPIEVPVEALIEAPTEAPIEAPVDKSPESAKVDARTAALAARNKKK